MNEIVTIIVPGYNCEKTIERCFNSVIMQKYRPIQFIFVNDGSTDKTDEIARNYVNIFSRNKIDFLYLKQQNKGQASAINNAISYVTGAFFMWFDSDDELLPDNIVKKVSLLDSNESSGFALCGLSTIFKAGKEEMFIPTIKQSFFEELIFSERPLPGYGQGTCLVRTTYYRDAVINNKIYESREGQNWQLMLPIAYHCNPIVVEEPLFKLYVTNNSHSRKRRTYNEEIERRNNFEKLLFETLDNISKANDDYISKIKQRIHDKYLFEKMQISFKAWNKKTFNHYFHQLRPEVLDKKTRLKNYLINSKMSFLYRFLISFFIR